MVIDYLTRSPLLATMAARRWMRVGLRIYRRRRLPPPLASRCCTSQRARRNPQTLDSRPVELGFMVEESSSTGNFENRKRKTPNLTWELSGNGEL